MAPALFSTISDSITLALSPDPSTIPFHRVEAMLHKFVIDLLDGYDTILGSGDDKQSILGKFFHLSFDSYPHNFL